MAVAGTYEQSAGVSQLYFPAFDSSDTNNGIAEDLDGERLGQFYGQLRYKNISVTGAYGRRRKHVPTASFGTLFNEQESRERSTDRHTLADVEYSRAIGLSHLTVRGSFDRFSYDGTYPFAGETSGTVLVGRNSVLGTRWSAGVRLTRALPHRQLVTVGAEFIDNVHQNQQFRYVEPPLEVFATDHSSLQHAVYLQDEVKLTRWLIANGGLRYDRYEAFQRVTPRAALIATPTTSQSFKYLYGRAFRAPNEYERTEFFFGESTRRLRPESIDTHELVWERYTNDWLRTSLSAYWYQADGLITPTPDPSAFLGTTYVNGGHVRANGLEVETQMRLGAGLQGCDELRVAARRGHSNRCRARQLAGPDGEIAAERAGAVHAVVRVGGGIVDEQPSHARRRHIETHCDRQCDDDRTRRNQVRAGGRRDEPLRRSVC